MRLPEISSMKFSTKEPCLYQKIEASMLLNTHHLSEWDARGWSHTGSEQNSNLPSCRAVWSQNVFKSCRFHAHLMHIPCQPRFKMHEICMRSSRYTWRKLLQISRQLGQSCFFFHLPSSVRWKGRGKGWGVEVANNELAMKDVDV